MKLVDRFNRVIDYLRISVTDRCNLRCLYCRPKEGITLKQKSEVLTFEELKLIIDIFVSMRIKKIKITGGEPLLRRGILNFIEFIIKEKDIKNCSITTNGMLLSDLAYSLKDIGVNRINISLDTLDKSKFSAITRGGDIKNVVNGINKVMDIGMSLVKINTVLLKNFNEDEILDFAEKSINEGWNVRFIECMPLKKSYFHSYEFLSVDIAKKKIEEHFGGLSETYILGNGPARYFRIKGAKGTIGFINAISNEKFCSNCNKIRLSADGKLRFCLFENSEIDLKKEIRTGKKADDIRDMIINNIAKKPQKHSAKINLYSMSSIGG